MATRTTTTVRGVDAPPGLTWFNETYTFADIVALFTTNEVIAPAKTGYAIQCCYSQFFYDAGATGYDFSTGEGESWTLGDLCQGLPSRTIMNGGVGGPDDFSSLNVGYGENQNETTEGRSNYDDTIALTLQATGTTVTTGDGTLEITLGWKYVKLPLSTEANL